MKPGTPSSCLQMHHSASIEMFWSLKCSLPAALLNFRPQLHATTYNIPSPDRGFPAAKQAPHLPGGPNSA